MKNSFHILPAAVTTLILIGCNPVCIVEFHVENGIESEIVIKTSEYSKEEIITLAPGDKQLFYKHYEEACMSAIEYDGNVWVGYKSEIEIDNQPLPESIWNVKYWEFYVKKHTKRYSVYTLIITDELLQSLETTPEDTLPN